MEDRGTGIGSDLRNALARSMVADPDQSWTMPGAYYTSEALLAAEKTELFAKEWICVGRAEEIPNPGNYLTYDILDEPFVIVRGADGRIRALSNVCRHRGAELVQGMGTARRLVCPYHAWTYDLGGQLIGAPEIPDRDDFDKRTCRLPEFPVEIWQGFIFTTLNPDPVPLAPRLSALDAVITPYHFEGMTTRYTTWEVWDTNWKSLVENFMEGYHLTPLHKETLHPVNPTALCQHMPPGDAHFGYTVGFSPDMDRVKRGHPDLTEDQLDTCVMFAVPPNLMVGGASDYSSFVCIEPASTDKTRVKMGLFFHGDDWSQTDVDTAVRLFHDTMEEDKTVLDRIGRGLKSAHYTPGPLAPAAFEGCVHDLQRYVATRLKHVVGAITNASA